MAIFDRVKSFFIFGTLLSALGWCGLGLFSYFTHNAPPEFVIHNVSELSTFGATIPMRITAHNEYKIGSLSVTIDGKSVEQTWVKNKQFDLPLSISTHAMADGEHTLEVTAQDTSYHSNSSSQLIHIIVDNAPLNAAFLESSYTAQQGKTLHVLITTNKRGAKGSLLMNTNRYPLTPISENSSTYECFIPIDCEEQIAEHPMTAELEDLAGHKAKIGSSVSIKTFEFPKQRGFTVSEEKISHEREVGLSMATLNEMIVRSLADSPKQKLWRGAFLLPIDVKRIPTPFGEIRTSPINGRYLHKGLDLANVPRSMIWASQNGTIIIKDRFFTTGNTVVIDHGLGVFTLYAHLDSFADIDVGQTVKKGSPLGKVGMTGYANGYHLHWELRINNIAVDPQEWTTNIF
jgi:murein DD-endopeptidase MepM/ murein hydrolase activator NlpD